MMRRLTAFTQARFQFPHRSAGMPGRLFGPPELSLLDHPFSKTSTTGDLLARAISDADIGGNAYFVRRGGLLYRLRPDWVTIVAGSLNPLADPAEEDLMVWDIGAQLVG